MFYPYIGDRVLDERNAVISSILSDKSHSLDYRINKINTFCNNQINTNKLKLNNSTNDLDRDDTNYYIDFYSKELAFWDSIAA